MMVALLWWSSIHYNISLGTLQKQLSCSSVPNRYVMLVVSHCLRSILPCICKDASLSIRSLFLHKISCTWRWLFPVVCWPKSLMMVQVVLLNGRIPNTIKMSRLPIVISILIRLSSAIVETVLLTVYLNMILVIWQIRDFISNSWYSLIFGCNWRYGYNTAWRPISPISNNNEDGFYLRLTCPRIGIFIWSFVVRYKSSISYSSFTILIGCAFITCCTTIHNYLLRTCCVLFTEVIRNWGMSCRRCRNTFLCSCLVKLRCIRIRVNVITVKHTVQYSAFFLILIRIASPTTYESIDWCSTGLQAVKILVTMKN